MYRILKVFVLLLMLFFSYQLDVRATIVPCNVYENSDGQKVNVSLTWDTDKEFDSKSNPVLDINGVKNTDKLNQFIFKWGQTANLTEAAEIDEKLYEDVLKTYACNDKMYVCAYFENSCRSVIGGLAFDGYEALIHGIASGDWNGAAEKVDIGESTLTYMVLTEQEYNEYKKYEGGKTYYLGHDEVEDMMSDGYEPWKLEGIRSLFTYISGATGIGDASAYAYKDIKCEKVYYKGSYIGVNINCGRLISGFVEYQGNVASYLECGKDDVVCKADAITELNNTESKLKAECSSVEKNLDYENDQVECLDACFKLNDTLNDYRKGTDLGDVDSSKLNQCGISDKIVNFISKVVKWIKYIAPVIVIILGILDFIKAIASSSEDEMKKTQGRFIKRVLAAAILFLVPFIIQFILEAFHLVNNNPFCSLF